MPRPLSVPEKPPLTMGKTLDLTSTGDGTPAEKKPSYTQTQTAYKNPAYETDYGGTSKNTTVVSRHITPIINMIGFNFPIVILKSAL